MRNVAARKVRAIMRSLLCGRRYGRAVRGLDRATRQLLRPVEPARRASCANYFRRRRRVADATATTSAIPMARASPGRIACRVQLSSGGGGVGAFGGATHAPAAVHTAEGTQSSFVMHASRHVACDVQRYGPQSRVVPSAETRRCSSAHRTPIVGAHAPSPSH